MSSINKFSVILVVDVQKIRAFPMRRIKAGFTPERLTCLVASSGQQFYCSHHSNKYLIPCQDGLINEVSLSSEWVQYAKGFFLL